MDTPKSFPFQQAKCISQLPALLPNDMRPKISVRTIAIPLVAQFFRQVEGYRDR